MISVILSSFNEQGNSAFWRNLDLFRGGLTPDLELLVVDGGSQDGTLDRLRSILDVQEMPNSHRAARYNWGIERAKGRVLLLVHPRSEFSEENLTELVNLSQSLDGLAEPAIWGAFRHQFDLDHPLLRFTSWYSNFVRGRFQGIFYLDHCLFLTRPLQGVARFPDVGIFEDSYFCLRMRKVSWPVLLKSYVKTSAIRFEKNGVWRQALLNQVMKFLFWCGASEELMNRVYERGVNLNERVGP